MIPASIPLQATQPHQTSVSACASLLPTSQRQLDDPRFRAFALTREGWPQLLEPLPTGEDADEQKALDFVEQLREVRATGQRLRNHEARKKLLASQVRHSEIAEGLLLLPSDIWREIARLVVDEAQEDGSALANASRSFHCLVTPLLYAAPSVKTNRGLRSLVGSLTAWPERASYVHSISLEIISPEWNQAKQLADLLCRDPDRLEVTPMELDYAASPASQAPARRPLRKLQVHFAGIDLEVANTHFLSKFKVTEFEWHTIPCWPLRREQGFAELLATWPQLRSLSLSGFRFDQTFQKSISGLSSLKRLNLSGRTMSSLSGQVLRELLEPGHDERDRQWQRRDSEHAEAEGPTSHQLRLQEITLADLPPGKATVFTELVACSPLGQEPDDQSLEPPTIYSSTTSPISMRRSSSQRDYFNRPFSSTHYRYESPPSLSSSPTSSLGSSSSFYPSPRSSPGPASPNWKYDCRDYGQGAGNGELRWVRSASPCL